MKATPLQKFRRRLRAPFEAALARLAILLVPALPRRALLALARLLARLGYALSPSTRRIGLENLAIVFPDLPLPRRKAILLASLRNFALAILDLFWFARRTQERMAALLTISDDLRALAEAPIPRIGLTAHLGNWELVGRYWGSLPGGLLSVAMPVKNTTVDVLFKALRANTGQRIIPPAYALRHMLRHLVANHAVGLLLDQCTPPWRGGVFVPFFGLPASISPIVGPLAQTARATVFFAYALPNPDGSYRAILTRSVPSDQIDAIAGNLPREEAALRVAAAVARWYEEDIRKYPEAWLWSYKRWHHIPAGADPAPFPSYAKPVT